MGEMTAADNRASSVSTNNLSRRNILKWTGAVVSTGILRRGVMAAESGPQVKPAESMEPDAVPHRGRVQSLAMPWVSCEGTASECGQMLGGLWKAALALEAQQAGNHRPWWKSQRFRPLVEKYCPHLPDLYLGMAKGAGVSEDAVGEQVPTEVTPSGCTSFAVSPEATLEGIPLSGQTKDVSVSRARELLVLRLKMSDAPSMLTLTYTGSTWLFGHGFVQGGTALFRNSLYVEKSSEGLPYTVWGLVALHCPTVGEVVEVTNRYGIAEAFHVVVADQRGGIVGIEGGNGGVAYLRPEQGIYAHGNAVMSDSPIRKTERDVAPFNRADSLHRTERLAARLRTDRGRLTTALAYGALCDHDGYPVSVCRHQSPEAQTAAAVIAEPTRGLLHVTCGAPCQHWPRTYSIG